MNTRTIGVRELRVCDVNTLFRLHDASRDALKGQLTRIERERAEKALLRTAAELRRRQLKAVGR